MQERQGSASGFPTHKVLVRHSLGQGLVELAGRLVASGISHGHQGGTGHGRQSAKCTRDPGSLVTQGSAAGRDIVYLLDANVLITAHRDYYPVKRVPEF